MPRERFNHKQHREGLLGFLFPYSLDRIPMITRSLIIGVLISFPVNLMYGTSMSKIDFLLENQNEATIESLYLSLAVLLVSIVLSVALFVLSFWMLTIPRLRSMGQSPKLAWLMLIPGLNVVFSWVLIFAPPKK